MSDQFHRLILKPPRNDVALVTFTLEEDWIMGRYIAPEPERFIPREMVFTSDGYDASLHYVDEPLVRFPYVQVVGRDRDEVAAILRDRVAFFTDEEIFRMWDDASSVADHEVAVLHLGVASPEQPEENFFSRIRTALHHPSPAVRLAAVLAVAYRGWKKFEPVLAEMSADDLQVDVRIRAQSLLEAIQT
jgi:hypothetical protein